MWSIVRSSQRPPTVVADGLPLPVSIYPVRGARRMRLRIDDARGILKLTCPLRTSRQAALRWAIDQREWVERQLAQRPPGTPFVPGTRIPVDGTLLELAWKEGAPRGGTAEGARLVFGGPEDGFSRRVERWLRATALEIMSADVEEFCAKAGLRAAKVAVGDAVTRWGSCSSAGTIRLSWRLVCASPSVRRYVVAHEVAHLRHLDHSVQFKALERALVGNSILSVKTGLRREGPMLRSLGRS